MKKIIVGFGILLLIISSLQSQISVNINIGSPPQWGPVGYSGVQYYYLPDVEAYYDVPSSRFIYYEGGSWVHRTYLPTRYRNYDLYGGYKVVMTDYHGKTPYHNFKNHKMKYGKGYRGHAQKNIGQRPGNAKPRGNIHSNGKQKNNAIHQNGNQNRNKNGGNNHKGCNHKNK